MIRRTGNPENEHKRHPARWGELGWVSFEFARAPTATLLFMFIFAPYFTRFVVGDTIKGVEYWGLANSIGAVLIAVIAPVLGAFVDQMERRKPYIILALACLAFAEATLWFARPAGQGGLSWQAIVAIIALCALLLELTAMLHNAMLDSVAPIDRVGRLSGLGYLASNTGTLLALGIMLVLIVLPAQGTVVIPGLTPGQWLDQATHEADRIVGPFAAMWLIAASIPFAVLTPDKPASSVSLPKVIVNGLNQLVQTLRDARRHANIGKFLLARMFYNDAIIALQAYAAIYGADVFGWTSSDIIAFALALAAVCAMGGFVAALIDRWHGSKRTIVIGNVAIMAMLAVMISCGQNQVLFVPVSSIAGGTNATALTTNLPETVFIGAFLCLGAVATIVLVSSRALLVKLVPPGMATQFFGIYSLSGYATAFAGHALVAGVTNATSSLSLGIASLVLLVGLGLILMRKVYEVAVPAASTD